MGGPGSGPVEQSGRGPTGATSLRALLLEVQRTRAAHLQGQGERGATHRTLIPVRRAALEALENYSAALQEQGWPTPAQMNLDIQLLRALCGGQ